MSRYRRQHLGLQEIEVFGIFSLEDFRSVYTVNPKVKILSLPERPLLAVSGLKESLQSSRSAAQ